MKRNICLAFAVLGIVVLSILGQMAAVRLGWYKLGEIPPPIPAPMVAPAVTPAPAPAPAPAVVPEAPKPVEAVKTEVK